MGADGRLQWSNLAISAPARFINAYLLARLLTSALIYKPLGSRRLIGRRTCASLPRASRAPARGRGIDVNAGGGVINGVEELYQPEGLQPSARD